MKIIKFNNRKHMAYVRAWLEARGEVLPTVLELPKLGHIAFDGHTPVAVGFLRRIEGNYAMFDSLISNPECWPAIRNAAIELIAQQVMSKASQLGIKHVWVISKDPHTITRSQKYGFTEVPSTLLIAILNN